MKKIAFGLAVLALLVAYSIGIRHEQPRLVMPTSLARKDTSTDTGSSGTAANSSTSSTSSSTVVYKDGTYTGSVADAFYGNVQVAVTIQGGKITNVKFLQYPDTHQTSVYINQQAMPYLQQEAIQAQSSHVDVVSGATFTSQAFTQSLTSALAQA